MSVPRSGNIPWSPFCFQCCAWSKSKTRHSDKSIRNLLVAIWILCALQSEHIKKHLASSYHISHEPLKNVGFLASVTAEDQVPASGAFAFVCNLSHPGPG